ncbi:MAG: hypothetical protein LBH06_07480 [Rikenellaceae bacterium]|jgi:hypothetical protein|nr:hypothetical protein [Rikenellaceae bacterium]
MKFSQLAAGDDLTRRMAQEAIKKSVLLSDYVEFFKKPGSSVTVRSGSTATAIDGQSRALGSDYAKNTVTPSYLTAGRKMLGDTVRIDMAFEKMGYDLSSEMTSQLTRRIREFGYLFNYAIVKGNSASSPIQFDGIAKLITAARTITAAENGYTLVYGNDNAAKKSQQELLSKIDEVVAMCEGTNRVIITNAKILSFLNTIARDQMIVQRNEFGIPVTFYNLIPLINIGDYQSAPNTYSPIINFDETVGTATNCASIYVVSFEEEDGLSLASCEGGFTVYPVQKVGNFLECTYELITDTSLIRPSALSKLAGIKMT